MAQDLLDVSRTYEDGEVLFAADLDAAINDIEAWALKTKNNLRQLATDVLGSGYVYDNDGLANRVTPLIESVATLDEDETVTGNWTFNGAGTLTISQSWTAAGETCADLGTVTTATSITTAALVATTADINGGTWQGTIDGNWTAAAQTCADLGTVTTADINGGTWQGTIDGNWTAAAQTCADIGTVTTADINGGTWQGTIDGNWTAAAQTCADIGTVTTADINGGTIGGVSFDGNSNVADTVVWAFNMANGTTPFTCASSTLVANLNADLLDGNHAAAFAIAGHTHDHGTLTGLGDDDHPQYGLLASAESVLAVWDFTLGIQANQLRINGDDIYERDTNADNGTVDINRVGYNGGITVFRDTRILDGKGAELLCVDGGSKSIYVENVTPTNFYTSPNDPPETGTTVSGGSVPANNQVTSQSLAKLWVRFTTDGASAVTTVNSYNVSGNVSLAGTTFTITVDKDFNDANYIVVGNASRSDANKDVGIYVSARNVGSIDVQIYDYSAGAAQTDSLDVDIVVFGSLSS